MKEGVQRLLSEIGEAGCLALCIVQLARPEASEGAAVDVLIEAIRRGFVSYDASRPEHPDNLFVRDRDGLFALASGESGWRSRTEGASYRAKGGERVIEAWEWEEMREHGARVLRGHFRLPGWDPLPGSRTVAKGRLAGYRVFAKAV